VFLDRTLIWVGLPGLLALTAGLMGLPRPWVRACGVVLVVACFAWGAVAYHLRKSKEPWRELADAVALTPPYAAKPMAYYRRHGSGRDDLLVPRWEDPREGLDSPVFERQLAAAKRVWLVQRHEQAFDPGSYWLTDTLRSERPLLSRRQFHDRLALELYGPSHGVNRP
jgi:hypothetical protein